MAKTLEELKKEATKSAKFRNHSILWIDSLSGKSAIGTCGCGEWVMAETYPAPNSIGIGGPAVALNCALKQVEFPSFGMK
jgi:hypothetical protein